MTRLARALLCLCWLTAAAPWSPLYAADDGRELQNYLDTLQSFQADFAQTVYDDDGQPLQRASGLMFMRRPGRFRWDYAEPFRQTIVADGEKLWLYDRDLEQVTVAALDRAVGAAPLALLSGAAPIERDFSRVESFRRNGLSWHRLRPRVDAAGDATAAGEITELRLAFAPPDSAATTAAAALRQIELIDAFGRRTVLELSRVVVNPALAEELFRFRPPAGVDVVEG